MDLKIELTCCKIRPTWANPAAKLKSAGYAVIFGLLLGPTLASSKPLLGHPWAPKRPDTRGDSLLDLKSELTCCKIGPTWANTAATLNSAGHAVIFGLFLGPSLASSMPLLGHPWAPKRPELREHLLLDLKRELACCKIMFEGDLKGGGNKVGHPAHKKKSRY